MIIHNLYLKKLFFITLLTSLSLLLNSCSIGTPPERKTPVKVITDVDRANLPSISFSVAATQLDSENNEASVSESSSGVVVSATLSKPVDQEVLFRFSVDVLDSTAENLSDFLIETPNATNGQPTGTSDVVTFEKNTTKASFIINMVNDLLQEKDEILSISIANNPGGDIQSTINLPDNGFGGHEIRIKIIDDEPMPAVEVTAIKIAGFDKLPLTNLNIAEGQESIAVTVSLLNTLSESDLAVEFELLAGAGAEEDVDYQFPFPENKLTPEGNISQIVFSSKQSTIEFFINVYTDIKVENPETITFKLIATEDIELPVNGVTEFSITITDAIVGNITLPDTGIDSCYGETDIAPCNSTEFPNQDADIQTSEPQFLKYNFVKASLDAGGQTQVSKPLADDASSWECVYDKNTKLLWAIGMKFRVDHDLEPTTLLRWFNPNPTTNGGSEGATLEDGEGSTVKLEMKTLAFRDLINDPGFTELSNESLCEVRNWRLPTLEELLSLMDFETPGETFIDSTFFPIEYVPTTYHWTSSPSAIVPKQAWCVFFGKRIKNAGDLCEKEAGLPALFVSPFDITTP